MRWERSFGLWAACSTQFLQASRSIAQNSVLMESPLSVFPMHRDHEPLTGETPPPSCCRHLAGSALLRLVFRQDACSTLGSSSAWLWGQKPNAKREWVCAPTSTKTEQA